MISFSLQLKNSHKFRTFLHDYRIIFSLIFSLFFTKIIYNLLLFPSLPIQCSQIFIKVGFLNYSIEGLGQSLPAGFYFIILQCKEFLYSYFSFFILCIIVIHGIYCIGI